MKLLRNFTFIILVVAVNFKTNGQDHHVRIAFMGNSITIGTGLANQATQCYPSQLGNMLSTIYGDTCVIGNFAVSGRTMLKHGDFPLWNEEKFDNALSFAPNICFILLGTNDSKPQNWDVYADEFIDDYQSMIDTFKQRNPYTKFIVCYPPPAYEIVWGIRDSVILNGVIPAVDSIVKKNDAILIDFYHPLIDSAYLFPDYIHPNVDGAEVMAKIIYDTLLATDIVHNVETDLTFVTSLTTDKEEISVNDTAVISWTTVNADTVFINGQEVSANGNMKVSPDVTTIYTLVAKGALSTDTMKLEQLVYQPQLSLLVIDPTRPKITLGDSIRFHTYFYDQRSKPMNDTIFDVSWSITSGAGHFIDESDTAITFIADSAGKIKVRAEIDTVFSNATVTVQPVTYVNFKDYNDKISVYPNPFNDYLNFEIKSNLKDIISISLYRIDGKLINCLIEESINRNTISLNTVKMAPGMYIYKVSSSNGIYKGIVFKSAE